MKKWHFSAFCILAIAGLLVACNASKPASGERKVVTVWYGNTGDEALVYEEAIAAYNTSQTKYEARGLSVNDQQKIIVAIASNEPPDVIKGSNSAVIAFQANRLLENLQPYAERDKLDLGIYSNQALAANTIDGGLFALPVDGYVIQMFYNKDILAAAGYSEPPKTVEEMYEMAVKATKLDASGNIDVLGYPLFPLASARQELIYGFGGRWWAADNKTLTPQSAGAIESLTYNQRYRNLYGITKVQSFIGTANTNRYTEQDMFFAGKQLFRLDGAWLPTMMKNFNSTVNWGLTLVPGTKAHPELRGSSRYETDSASIPITATNKDGGWDFIKWLSGYEGAKIICAGTGVLPALKALYNDPAILAMPGFPEFIEALSQEKGIQYAQIGDLNKYISLLNEYLDYVYAGQMTPEAALAALADQAKSLQ
ncbi:putative bacterial extracellular solute-binding protein [Treponema primitia ZAS-2]|uniref:Putative bacterial extracellular solute-binding protein n=1 Tax=Treponema primitia (strain ATCC BAA-887 / DSM 12427 / ZAS-2) TaxID=545694 RepID=F5YGZ8_TREPZ|nr:extracellular solute-binding protein [Treponema primitia]AEF85692.1 putative bacterial extracellular solute-binding protein [Treponema primitia ZAS-2]